MKKEEFLEASERPYKHYFLNFVFITFKKNLFIPLASSRTLLLFSGINTLVVLILLLLQGCDGSAGEPGRLYFSKDNVDLGASGEETACQCRKCKRHGFDPWLGKTPWRRAWQPTPGFLPGESPGQRSLAGYSPKGLKQLDTTEVT